MSIYTRKGVCTQVAVGAAWGQAGVARADRMRQPHYGVYPRFLSASRNTS